MALMRLTTSVCSHKKAQDLHKETPTLQIASFSSGYEHTALRDDQNPFQHPFLPVQSTEIGPYPAYFLPDNLIFLLHAMML